MKLLIGTGNPHKVEEILLCLGAVPVVVIGAYGWDGLSEPVEDGSNFEENALIKAKSYSVQSGLPCLAEDSGLEVDALGGAPGLLSARYAGQGATHQKNNDKLLKALSGVPLQQRSARFVCVAALHVPSMGTWTCRGVCEGRIIEEARGGAGFGYDPLFCLIGTDGTMAELSKEEKCRVSHRAQAMTEMAEVLKDVKREWNATHST